MAELPEPDWYLLEHARTDAEPAGPSARKDPVTVWRQWWQQQADARSPVLRAAAHQGFVLGAGQLADLGVSRQRARTSVARGRWTAPAHGAVSPLSVVGDADDWIVARRRHALAAAAAVLLRTDHVVSGRSAAILHGLPTLAIPRRPELTDAEPRSLGRRRGPSHVYGAELVLDEVTNWFGAPITTVARTLIDLARHNRRDGLMAADAALRAGVVESADIETSVDTARGWPGVRQARDILAFADARAESPLESLTRLALHDDGFPPPELQVEIAGYRVDMLWPGRRFILEADGRPKYTDEAPWREPLWQEKVREQHLRKLGYSVERVIWPDVTRDWPATSARLRSLLRLPA